MRSNRSNQDAGKEEGRRSVHVAPIGMALAFGNTNLVATF